MTTIYKYPLTITDNQILEIPGFNPEFLTVQVQNDIPCLWAIVEPENPKRKAWISTFGTGQPLPDNFKGQYLGTYQLSNGLVFHVFNTFGKLNV